MTTQPKPPQPLLSIAGIGGALFGVAVSRYAGLNLLVPLGAAFLVGWIAAKYAHSKTKPMVAAFAVQSGHALWLVVGMIVLGNVNWIVLDIAIFAVGLTWLIMRPGLGPVMLLAIYQVLALIVNVTEWMTFDIGSALHRAMFVHVLFRLAALILLFVGLFGVRRASQEATPSPPIANP